MTTTESGSELSALQTVISALQAVDDEARRRIFEAAATFLGLRTEAPMSVRTATPATSGGLTTPGPAYPSFSEDTSMSPKEFLYEKQPRTDVERMAVLAFYLAHYRDTPQFKTLDLSKLNTEAAQPKFSNAANTAANAVKQGYLVPTTKGARQLSAAGERFVLALPDREAARIAMSSGMPRRKKSSSSKSSTAKRAAPAIAP